MSALAGPVATLVRGALFRRWQAEQAGFTMDVAEIRRSIELDGSRVSSLDAIRRIGQRGIDELWDGVTVHYSRGVFTVSVKSAKPWYRVGCPCPEPARTKRWKR